MLLAGSLLPGSEHAAKAQASPEIFRLDDTDRIFARRLLIQEIQILGTAYAETAALAMSIRAGDRIEMADLQADQQRLVALGYFAQVDPRLQALPGGGYRLTIQLTDNPRLERVLLTTPITVLTPAEVLEPFEALEGSPINFQELTQLRQGLEMRYRQQGYGLARIEMQADPQGILRLAVHEGVLEAYLFEGLEKTQTQVLLRELRLQPGEKIYLPDLEADLNGLRQTGFFERLVWRAEPGQEDPGQVLLVLEVTETPTRDIGLDATFNNRDGLLGGAHYTDPNFLGRGQLLNLRFQAGLDFFNLFGGNLNQSQRALYGQIEFFDPWLWPGRTGFGASLFADRIPLFFGDLSEDLPFELPHGLRQNRSGLTLRLSRPLFGAEAENSWRSPWHGQLSLSAEQIQLENFLGEPQRELTVARRFSATDIFFNAQGRVSFDNRNDLLEPNRGLLASLSLQPVWGDSAYIKLTGQAATYFSLIPDWLVLALNLQGGSLQGGVPIYEQFYGTGFAALRGWPENGRLFGQHYLLGSVEARQQIWGPLSLVLFGDLGQFWSSANVEGLRYGLGLGVRVQSPLGLIRLDYGIRDPLTWNLERAFEVGQLHFGIGHKF